MGDDSACTRARPSVSAPSCEGVAWKDAPTKAYTEGSICSSRRSMTCAVAKTPERKDAGICLPVPTAQLHSDPFPLYFSLHYTLITPMCGAVTAWSLSGGQCVCRRTAAANTRAVVLVRPVTKSSATFGSSDGIFDVLLPCRLSCSSASNGMEQLLAPCTQLINKMQKFSRPRASHRCHCCRSHSETKGPVFLSQTAMQ